VSPRPVILAPVRYYLPGFRSGGPVRSVSNLVDRLGDEYDFRIVTFDRDFGDAHPYSTAVRGQWVDCGKARVRYLSPREAPFVSWRALLRESDAHVVYLNSVFDRVFSVRPLTALKSARPVVVAPRGELSAGALSVKAIPKQFLLRLFKLFRLHTQVHWHASSAGEADEIRRNFRSTRGSIAVAANIPNPASGVGSPDAKRVGSLRVAFLSRVAPKKNLLYAIRAVSRLSGDVTFDIWGPVDDVAYWRACQKEMATSPANVRIAWRGDVPNEQVPATLVRYDVFLFPTLGENFGHVVVDALDAGLPVVISDRTPWTQLREAGVGVDLPLSEEAAFVRALQEFQKMDDATMTGIRARCRAYAERWRTEVIDPDQYRRLFEVSGPRESMRRAR
jgi:glycosyltransferase involved in cell wall biosynthesis